MPKYLWEFVRRIVRRVDVVIGLAINVVALVAAGISGLGDMALALLAVSILAVVLLWGAFAVFQEERHKTDRSLEVRAIRPRYLRAADWAAKVLLHENGRIHAFVYLRYFFVNHLSTDVEIMDCNILWQTARRLRRGQTFARLPFHQVGESRTGSMFPMRLAGARKSVELEGMFEVTFVPDDFNKLPRHFRFVMEVDVAGAPRLSLPVAAFEAPRWSKPAEPGMAFHATTAILLSQFPTQPIVSGD